MAAVDFRAGELAASGPANGLAGQPVFWLVVLADPPYTPGYSENFLGRNYWIVGDDLVIYARIQEGADTGVGGQFWVADVAWIAFDLDALGSEQLDWSFDQTKNGSLATRANNINSEGWKEWHANSQIQLGVGRQWLNFYHVHYQARQTGASALPPRFQFGYFEGGWPSAGGTWNTLLGSRRLGQCNRGRGGPYYNDIQMGGFAANVQPSPASGYSPAIRSYDLHNVGTDRTQVHLLKTFSVRVDKCAFLRTKIAQQALTGGGVGRPRVTSGFLNSTSFEPFEITVPRSADYTVLHQGIVRHEFPRSPPQWRHYCPTAMAGHAAGSGRNLGPFSMLGPVIASKDEGILAFEMVNETISGAPGTAAPARYEFFWWGRIGPSTPNDNWDVEDLISVGFFLDDNPANVPTGLPAAPVPVLLIPGREALGLGSLNAILFEPDAKSAVTLEVPLLGLRTDTGYERTWPKFSKVRREWRWTWQRLSRADRDTLEAFLIANPTFKYTEPDAAAATAFAVTGRPESIDEGFLYTVTCNVGELVFVGP